ncbi:NAD(P)-dependent oxidoreductase [Falsochrobactrum shanghaiense]|uniref:NAD(P)-dependent oxidoreductase n=1 Tax=Falsochrobactrum shanghaiense TaxID=2201899 RepID=A0A316J538_9HYPH|nr:SDR family NAD(P)-dependent oxidoreductase [Falsochrobactrum shanghaiense]PWL16496.1 NAD(P)-dependent oxidoreductase [Falsochrobactrum shanghaiense]
MINLGFKGKTFFVQGGTSGVGKAAARILLEEGAKVGITGTSEASVVAALAELREISPRVAGRVANVKDKAAIEEAVTYFETELGPIDGLLICAAISGSAPAEDLDIEEWNNVLSVNLSGAFLTAQCVGRQMIARRCGAIVFVGSTDGLGGHPSRTHYVASKHGLNGLTKNLALEWGRHGIRINCIAPNAIDTPMLQRNMPPAFLSNVIEDRTPLGRVAQASEIASAALLLLSEAASYITGATVPVDGGLTAGFWTRRNGADYSSKRLLDAGIYEE